MAGLVLVVQSNRDEDFWKSIIIVMPSFGPAV